MGSDQQPHGPTCWTIVEVRGAASGAGDGMRRALLLATGVHGQCGGGEGPLGSRSGAEVAAAAPPPRRTVVHPSLGSGDRHMTRCRVQVGAAATVMC
jgi:hypothetical protein